MYVYSERCCVALILLFILIQADGFYLGHNTCNLLRDTCGKVINQSVIGDREAVDYCINEDIPHARNIHYILNNQTGTLKLNFAPPKRECGLGVALLINPLIKNEAECKKYTFLPNNAYSSVHTVDRTICILKGTNQRNVGHNKTLTSSCQDNIELSFHHIFTGCYAVRFHIGFDNYVIRDLKFFYTSYQRTEIAEPPFTCKYDTHLILNQRNQMTNFTLEISLPIDSVKLLEFELISPRNENQRKECVWSGEGYIEKWSIRMHSDDRCTLKSMQIMESNGKNIRTIQCNFQVEQNENNEDYCFLYRVKDIRCHKNTIWKPLHANPHYLCTWVKRCKNVSLHLDRIETIESNKSQSTNILLPIIASILIVLVIGIGFWYLCIRKKKITLFVNSQHDDFLNSACFESTDLSVVDNNDSDKEIDHDNLSSNDIVLLYTKNSISFMALMKDFRETLAKMCSCSVYDWYEEAEWNDVAKVGPVSWFTKLLSGKCRVVWIDTPITRSVIISKENASSLNILDKYIIGDFRDTAFPVVLELAKRNINDTVQQYRRHFVVRFEGLESMVDVNDPFLDLSPHARYRMPHHLTQLCIDLSMEKSVIPKYQIKVEENLLEQRLKLVKMESIM